MKQSLQNMICSATHRCAAAVVFLLVLACIGVQPLKADVFEYQDESGLYFLCDDETLEAVLIANKDASVYKKSAVAIPATIAVSSGTLGSGGGSESEKLYKVTAIGENALNGAWAFSITFADNSNVRVIRKRGMYSVKCSGTMALPASLQVIEEEGLYVKSSDIAQSFISTLILPASLDSLGKSAIVLNKLQTLQFLGTTPPKCHYTESSNPWAGTDAATPDNITVTYPEGAYTAYNNRKGIGTYFTSFTGPDETPTGLEERQEAERATAMKVMRNGQVLIVREGRCYTAMGQLVIDN